jgi:hypothetical protein
MVAKEGKIKLMDFGIARPVESSLMTMDGAVMGTMQYLAPEQIDGKNVGVAADIYALGEVLYETLTGRKAFPQKNLSQLMAAKTGNNFLPLRLFKRDISPVLRSLVDRCMLFDPKKRPRSAASALKELERVHHRETLDPPEEVIRSFLRSPLDVKTELDIRKPFPVRAMVAAAAVAAAIVTIGVLTLPPPKKHPPLTALPAARAPSVTTETAPASPEPNATMRKPTASQPVVKRTLRKAVAETPRPAPSVIPEKTSYLDEIKAKHGTGDPLEALAKEAELGRYESVLRLCVELPPEAALANNARLLRLRALYALGKRTEAADLVREKTIEDGEYYLIKAKLSYAAGDADQGLKTLEKSVEVHAQMLDAETLHRDYFFYRALCLGRVFDQTPSEENKKSALDAWFEVKNHLRKIPDHSYFKKAVLEMQRIGDARTIGKG